MSNTADFIRVHRDDDVRRLALQAAGRTDIDMPFALDQIAGWQTARRKLPSWAATDGLTYPPHISMEQCSGEPAARYKAAVARRLADGRMLVDITGGFGVDFSFMAHAFARAVYVERQEHLCRIAVHNMRLLGLGQAKVECGDGVGYVRRMEGRASVIFADPARRDGHGGRTFAISDCTPDVLGVMPLLLDRADHVMLKLSPMLDWRKAVADIETAAGTGDNGCGVVREVHVVAVDNECKELLVVASRRGTGRMMFAVNVGPSQSHEISPPQSPRRGDEECDGRLDVISFPLEDCALRPAIHEAIPSSPLREDRGGLGSLVSFLHEPNAAIMKAGCFGVISRRYGVRQIGRDSHLFVSDAPVEGFPGRSFRVEAVTTMNKKELRHTLDGISRANITVRNFPMTADALRRRLRLADGGTTYIFATTIADGTHVLFVCSKTLR